MKFLDPLNPYRCLFPIGCLNGILGAILWIAFARGWIVYYPAQTHAQLMIGGFVFSYALGFLWTALPRFLQSPYPSKKQISSLFLLCLFSSALAMRTDPSLFYISILALLGLTIQFGISSFKRKKGNPFPSFVFVFAALALATISALTLTIGAFVELPDLPLALARTFFLKGFVLFLYLGIGAKLVPVLTGWHPLPDSAPNSFHLDPLYLAGIPVLIIGFILETLSHAAWAGPVYGVTLCAIGFLRMNLAHIPKEKSALSFCVWISALSISLSPFLLIFFPSYASHFWHLIFFSGFGLLTIFVSLRVTLAHSEQNFLLLEKKPVFYVMGFLILFGAATRVSAPFMPKIMLSHYAYSAAVWIIALLLWIFYFVKFTYFERHSEFK